MFFQWSLLQCFAPSLQTVVSEVLGVRRVKHMCSANCTEPEILGVYLCRLVCFPKIKGMNFVNSSYLTLSCHILWGHSAALVKRKQPQGCTLKKIPFVCIYLIFKNYEA